MVREIESPRTSSALYDKLSQDTRRLFDSYFWMKDEVNIGVASILKEVAKTGELVIDEYEKVESIRRQSEKALREAATAQKDFLLKLIPDSWDNIRQYSDALEQIQLHQGRLISLKDLRYMDISQVEGLEAQLATRHEEVSRSAAAFLAGDKALAPYLAALTAIDESLAKAANVAALNEPEKAQMNVPGTSQPAQDTSRPHIPSRLREIADNSGGRIVIGSVPRVNVDTDHPPKGGMKI